MKLLIAGGGTGGHVFTGIALAREWVDRGKDFQVVFVGSKNGLEGELVPRAGFRVEMIPVFGFKRLSLQKKIRAIAILPQAFLTSFSLLLREKPDVAVGVGGYASLPVLIAASLLGIPTAFIEQNSIPGLANRLLGRWARKIFLAFDVSRKFFPKQKCLVTGNPVRREIIPEALSAQKSGKRFRVLIFGGSQGAKKLDQAALDSLPVLKDLAGRLSVVHQCRGELFDALVAQYAAAGVEAQVIKFIHEMGKVYGEADLVVCRAGALSIAELATLGKPAVLVPYPFAADDHQMANAKALADQGAAILVADKEFTGFRLAEIIRDLVEHPQNLANLSERILRFSSARSAQRIMDACQAMA